MQYLIPFRNKKLSTSAILTVTSFLLIALMAGSTVLPVANALHPPETIARIEYANNCAPDASIDLYLCDATLSNLGQTLVNSALAPDSAIGTAAGGTVASDDPQIKYRDVNIDGVWIAGPGPTGGGQTASAECVFRDVNDNNVVDTGEALGGTCPGTGTPKDDPKIKFLDSNANGIRDVTTERVFYDFNNNGVAEVGTAVSFTTDIVLYNAVNVFAWQVLVGYDASRFNVIRFTLAQVWTDATGAGFPSIDNVGGTAGFGITLTDVPSAVTNSGPISMVRVTWRVMNEGASNIHLVTDVEDVSFGIQLLDSESPGKNILYDTEDGFVSTTDTISVLPNPEFTFSPGNPVSQGATVVFDASTSVDVASFAWDFGDASSGSGAMVSHSYANACEPALRPSPINTGGCYRVFLRGTNPAGTASSTKIVIVQGAANSPPTLDAISDSTIGEQTLLSFTATATDPDAGQTLTFSLAPGAPTGAAITAGGAFSWTPSEAQGPGDYSITAVVMDDGSPSMSDSQSFTVHVNEANLAPVLDAIGDKSVDELALLQFTATASDADLPANVLTFSCTCPSGASISASGVFSWTPTEAQGPGTYPATIIVSDGSLTDSETIMITVSEVNQAPILDPVGDKSVDEGTLLAFTATATDSDLPVQTLTFSLGPGAPVGSSISAGGLFTWTPDESQGPASYTITIIVSDGVAQDSETITVTVAEVNIAPTVNVPGPQSVALGDTLTFTVTATDPDLPDNTITLSAFGLVTGMSFNAATGEFTFTPTSDQAGLVFTVSFTAQDNGVPSLSDTKDVVITVGTAANNPPTLDPVGDKTVDEGTQLSFTATATDPDVGQALTFSLGPGAPSGASIAPGGVFIWTPTEAQGPGTYQVTIIVSDNGIPSLSDSETITINVNEVNLAPVLDPVGDKTVVEGTLLSFTATASDADLPPQLLTFSLEPGSGTFPTGASITLSGMFTWTPTLDQGPATYAVRIVVSDGSSTDFEEITITVTEPTPENHPPVLDAIGDKTIDEETLLTFTATATDIDGDALMFSLGPGSPSGASITSTGVFTWTPSEAQGPGSYSITIIVSDGQLTDSETITVAVSELNQPPTLDPVGDKTVDELTQLSFTATAADVDLPPNALTFSLDGAPVGASITPSGTFTWTPTEAQGPGTYPVTVMVSDGALSDSETIMITVNEVNSPPVAAFTFTFTDTNGNGQIDIGETVDFDAGASSDPDIPTDPITSHVWDFGDGVTGTGQTVSHIYTTAGSFTVALTVTDGHTATDTASTTINVGAPVAHARLNRWKTSPAFHHQDLSKNPTQTLRAHAVNDGEVPIYVYVLFTIISDTGPSQMLPTQIVALQPGETVNGKLDPRFAVSFDPAPGSYTVTATVYYATVAGLPIGDPGYTGDFGSSKTFSFTAV